MSDIELVTCIPDTLLRASGVPALISDRGVASTKRFVGFFTDQIRNPNTREAYHRAAMRFFDWCEARELGLDQIESFHVAAYVELLLLELSKASVKQHLAAIRRLFDWLVVGHICPTNPAAAVRGPRHTVLRGKTPVLDEADCRLLLASIDVSGVVGLRDRALIATMTYTFGRISAVLGMDVGDYCPNGKRWWVRLHEKGGKDHEMPAHHRLEEYLDDYLAAVPFAGNNKHPLFPTAPHRGGRLTDTRMTRTYAWRMVGRRARAAGVVVPVGNHSLRATGITNYRGNGGSLDQARVMACHADTRTTQLYDRSGDAVSLDEVQRISI